MCAIKRTCIAGGSRRPSCCASQPDRSLAAVRDAPGCIPPASVCVTLSETAGALRRVPDPGPGLPTCPGRRPRTGRLWPPRGPPGSGVPESSSGASPRRRLGELARQRRGSARLWPSLSVDAEPARRPSRAGRGVSTPSGTTTASRPGSVVEPESQRRRQVRAHRPGGRHEESPDTDPGHVGAALCRVQQRPGGRVVVVAALRRLDALRRGRPSTHLLSRTGRRTCGSEPGLLQDGIRPAQRRRGRSGPGWGLAE